MYCLLEPQLKVYVFVLADLAYVLGYWAGNLNVVTVL